MQITSLLCIAVLISGVGNKADIGTSRVLQFRGLSIFRSLIADLKNKPGANLTKKSTEVLLAGGSAGGIGVMVHLDWLATTLPHAKVRGLNDAGWFAESSAVNPAFRQILAPGISYWNGKPEINCASANPKTKRSMLPIDSY